LFIFLTTILTIVFGSLIYFFEMGKAREREGGREGGRERGREEDFFGASVSLFIFLTTILTIVFGSLIYFLRWVRRGEGGREGGKACLCCLSSENGKREGGREGRRA